jgi:hypothetical protein
VNTGGELLRVLCCAGPAFQAEAFDRAHRLAS